jgi:FAD/FMN-containing dehydrogenase
MIDHFCITVPAERMEEVTKWYLAALAPLGYTKQMDYGVAVGLGTDPSNAKFWIGAQKGNEPTGATHFAFGCHDHAVVDEFHKKALEAGGKCNGQPGLRPMYHDKYYAAFVFDPVGCVVLSDI